MKPPLLAMEVATDLAEVGGKARQLAVLRSAGLPTPDGRIIPDRIFQAHLQHAGVGATVERLFEQLDVWSRDELEGIAEVVRARIKATGLQPEVQKALRAAREHFGPDRRLAVRSSAVGEDHVRHSFAGQLDSVLDVVGEEALEAAVKTSWSSLFALRVLLYSRQQGVRARHMGVILQPQVDACWSGVLFTRDPNGSQHDTMVAEFCSGLGEALVAGRVNPGRLRIGRDDLNVNFEAPDGEGAVLPRAAVSAVREIARLGLRLELDAGTPQDLEWCIDGANRPVLVQCRPARINGAACGEPLFYWSNANIAENFPEPVSPFLYSVVKPGYSAYFRNLGIGFGVSRQRMAAMAAPLADIVGLQGGRLYYNLSNIHALIRTLPAGRHIAGFFDLFVGAKSIPTQPTVHLSRAARCLECARIAIAVLWQYTFIQRRLRRFETRVDTFAAVTHPERLSVKSAAELAADLRGVLRIRMEQWNDAALADTGAMVCYGLLKAQLARALPGADHHAIHNDLLKGLPDLASAVPVDRLWILSKTIASDTSLADFFARSDPDSILAALERGCYPEFRAAFDEYLERWGFRSSAELMLTTPTPREDPRALLGLLKAYLSADSASPREVTDRQRREREAATAAATAQLTPNAWWRRVPLLCRASRFRLLLAATQGAIGLRERARMKQALLYTRLRHIALRMGEVFVTRDLLPTCEDIFLLTTDEVLALADGAVVPELSARMAQRSAALKTARTQAPPDHLVLRADEPWSPTITPSETSPAHATARQLHGNSACGGVASGRAAVVVDVADAGHLEAGDILVTRQTDPGWATVFFLVGGLVIERGGMLSHGAIIAREYGIPAVVGVAGATRLIRSGDRLRVDGDQGLVELDTH